MSRFVTYISMHFSKYAPTTDGGFVDRIGIMTIDGATVTNVTVHEDRTVTIMAGFKTYVVRREELYHAEYVSTSFGIGHWCVQYEDDSMTRRPVAIVKFYDDVSHEGMRAVKESLYDFD